MTDCVVFIARRTKPFRQVYLQCVRINLVYIVKIDQICMYWSSRENSVYAFPMLKEGHLIEHAKRNAKIDKGAG